MEELLHVQIMGGVRSRLRNISILWNWTHRKSRVVCVMMWSIQLRGYQKYVAGGLWKRRKEAWCLLMKAIFSSLFCSAQSFCCYWNPEWFIFWFRDLRNRLRQLKSVSSRLRKEIWAYASMKAISILWQKFAIWTWCCRKCWIRLIAWFVRSMPRRMRSANWKWAYCKARSHRILFIILSVVSNGWQPCSRLIRLPVCLDRSREFFPTAVEIRIITYRWRMKFALFKNILELCNCVC